MTRFLLLATLGTIAGLMAFTKPDPTAPSIVAALPYEEARVEAVRRWARRFEVDTVLALKVSRQENYGGIPTAVSYNGCCFGIMQVHVRWTGRFHDECGGSDLLSVNDSACYGVLILKDALRMCKGEETCALRVYHLGPQGRWASLTGDAYVKNVRSRSGE